MKTIGEVAFEAYNDDRGGVNHLGKKTPDWVELPDEIRHAWEAAANDVASWLGVGDAKSRLRAALNGHEFDLALAIEEMTSELPIVAIVTSDGVRVSAAVTYRYISYQGGWKEQTIEYKHDQPHSSSEDVVFLALRDAVIACRKDHNPTGVADEPAEDDVPRRDDTATE